MSKTYLEQLECFSEGKLTPQDSKELILTLKGKPELLTQLQDNLYMDSLIDNIYNEPNEDFFDNLMNKVETLESQDKKAANFKVDKSSTRLKTKKKQTRPIIYLTWIGSVAAAITFAFIMLNSEQAKPATAGLTSTLLVATIDNDAQLIRNGKTTKLSTGDQLYENDEIVSLKGTTVLNFKQEATFVEIKENGHLKINYSPKNNAKNKDLKLFSGKAHFNIQKQKEGNSMVVSSKEATVTVIGTRFDLDASADKSTITVQKGLISITNKASGDIFTLPENFKVILKTTKFPEIISTVNKTTPEILGYTVIDPFKHSPVVKYLQIKNGAVINIADLPKDGYNIRANITQHSLIKNVEFTLKDKAGNILRNFTEKFAPYSMVGDDYKAALRFDYRYNKTAVKAGTYTLETKIYVKKQKEPQVVETFTFTLK